MSSRWAAATRAVLIAAGATLLVFLLLGVVARLLLSAALGHPATLQGKEASIGWGLLVAAPICGAVFVTVAWVLYVRYTTPRQPDTER